MEILSDVIFHGSVVCNRELTSQSINIMAPHTRSGLIQLDDGNECSALILTVCGSGYVASASDFHVGNMGSGDLFLQKPQLYIRSKKVVIPDHLDEITLASKDQIPSKTYRANRTIPANCTAFEFVDCYTNSNDNAWVCVSHNYEKMLTQVVDGGYGGGNVIQMDIKHVYDYDNNRVKFIGTIANHSDQITETEFILMIF